MMNDDYFAQKDHWEKDSNEPDKKPEKPVKAGIVICIQCHNSFMSTSSIKVQYCPFCNAPNFT